MTSKLSKSSDLYEPSHRRSKKFMNITVFFLDDSSHVFQLQAKTLGQLLFEKVCKHINLLEVDYFGLECEDEKGKKYWLDVLKPLCSQLHSFFPSMYFCVKFYTPDPVQLEDEFTRYLFGLQIKKDFISGALQCNDSTAAVLLSYIVQADLGDFNPEVCIDHSYLTKYKFVAYQDEELEKKIMENHRKIIGQTPAEADLNLLETARRCELYGVKMTPAKDHEGVPLNLAVVHLGVLVFQNFTKINTFSWAKIRKLSFKRKKFLVKLHPEGYGFYKDTVEFVFDSRNECKNFWKKCIENHTFFRCSDAKQGMRMKPKIFSRGSSFRYSGRTQKQVSEFVRQNNFQKTQFQRSTSCRTPTSPTKSISSSIVPQPLLPVTSSSCGSMSDVPKDVLLPPKSTSEPTTPHTAPDFGKISNGSANVSGVVSPESDLAGFQSPEFCMQDTDDNISHDSYHVLDTNQAAAAATNTDNPSTNKEIETVSDFKEDDGNSVGEIRDNSALNSVAYNNNIDSVKADNNNTESISIEALKIDSKTNDLNILESSPTDSLDLSSQDMNNLKQILLNQEQDGISLSSSDNLSYNENILSQELKNYKNVLSDSYFRESSKNSNNEETFNNSKNSEHVFGASTFYVSSSPYSAGRLSSKRKVMNDRAYCLAKELLMTERTYRKDLEVVNVTFRDNYYSQKDVRSEAIEQFLSVVDPLHEMHCFLLRDLEQRLAFWEGRPVNKNQNVIKGVANILYAQKDMIKMHSTYLKKLPKLLEMLYDDLSRNQLLNQFYQQFEAQKVCYLPLSSFLLRPAFRLVYYHSLVKNLLDTYNSDHDDYNDCLSLYDETKTFCESFENIMLPLVNYSKLVELQRSFTNFSSLVDKNRKFIREGCLSKFIKSGTQQCMFFLFSDILLCTLRTHDGRLSFKVQGLFPLKSLKIQETGDKLGFTHCFILCSPEKHLYLASPSSEEHTKWMRDLQNAIASQLPCKSSPFSLEEEEEEIRDVGQHINTSIHICWHRNISISCADLYLSMKNSLSGYLLRKFKNSSGWQKVWVVLANLCLFFYRSYLDESPLGSLPLAGYKIMTTSSNDLVSGDCIFKLIFKNHEYFFMVENKYAFKRWMEVIHSCTLVEEENTHL